MSIKLFKHLFLSDNQVWSNSPECGIIFHNNMGVVRRIYVFKRRILRQNIEYYETCEGRGRTKDS